MNHGQTAKRMDTRWTQQPATSPGASVIVRDRTRSADGRTLAWRVCANDVERDRRTFHPPNKCECLWCPDCQLSGLDSAQHTTQHRRCFGEVGTCHP